MYCPAAHVLYSNIFFHLSRCPVGSTEFCWLSAFFLLALFLVGCLCAQGGGAGEVGDELALPAGLGQLFGAAHGGVGLVRAVETVVVDFIKILLQGQDGSEAMSPQHLGVHVGAASLASHPWGGNREMLNAKLPYVLTQPLHFV